MHSNLKPATCVLHLDDGRDRFDINIRRWMYPANSP